MSLQVDRGRVRALFESGVAAVAEQAEHLDGAAWASPACGDWTAAETCGHVLCVSRWYHAWLDRALAGEMTRPFTEAEMDAQNAAALADLGPMSGSDAVAAFAGSALEYLERVVRHWDVPYAYPYGVATAGLHAGIAATEWHLHAWDLSQVTGSPHTPDDPDGLFLAAGACLAAHSGRLQSALMSVAVPIAARRSPWQTMLKRSGRKGSAG